jgi:hypothetical protein
MAEKAAVHPIRKVDLDQHLPKATEKLTSLLRHQGEIPVSLVELVKDIGGDAVTHAPEVNESLAAIKTGACLYYEMYSILEKRIRQAGLEEKVDVTERAEFLGAFSMFAASSYIAQKLTGILKEEEPADLKIEKPFRFDYKKEDVLTAVLSRCYGVIDAGKAKKTFERGVDLPIVGTSFFRKVVSDALTLKSKFKPELVSLVNNVEFNVAEEFEINGFQVEEAESRKGPKVEIVRVTPGEVVGNDGAKKKVIRYMDRLALYDPIAKNNPCVVLGGLSWTNLWDGIPGTGKTTMMRMAITRLADLCQQIGLKYKVHAIDQSVKSEFYGKTGQNALAEFNSTRDPTMVHITTLDDLDLLTQGSRNDSGGADNDLRNVIMQFLDGIFTLRIGNNQVYSASNDPKGLDSAIRNRHNDRILVEGPKTAEDLSDMFVILTKKLSDNGVIKLKLGYTPFLTQNNYVDGKWTKPDEVLYQVDPEFAKRFRGATVKDFGYYLMELKKVNPSISGRSVKAIVEAIKERSANFDVPTEVFEKPEFFLRQPFDKKIDIANEWYMKINDSNAHILFEEAKRYAESEGRYSQGEMEREIERGYNSRIWHTMAELRAMEDHPELYGAAEALRLLIAQDRTVVGLIQDRVNAGAKKIASLKRYQEAMGVRKK